MEIIKELRRNERNKRVNVRISKGIDIGVKLYGVTDLIKGKTLKQSSNYIKIEIGRKQKRLVLQIPKRVELVEDILF